MNDNTRNTEDAGNQQQPKDRWQKRRAVIYSTLMFCAVTIVYLIFDGKDTELNNTIANGLILLASSVIIAFIGGSSYEDTRIKSDDKKDPFR